MKPELSIIITSFKNPALLELCINSLKEAIFGLKFEIIVADSATQQATIAMMRDNFPDVVFFQNKENMGFGFLVNQGIRAAKGEYLFVINADIIIKDKSAVADLLGYLRTHPDVGMAGPQLINFDNSTQQSCFRFYTPWTIIYRRTFLNNLPFARHHLDQFLMEDKKNLQKPIEADWLMGSAVMVSRKAVDMVGLMDSDRYFLYFEDVDWCWRFWEKGYKVVYYPLVRVFHYHGKASGSQNAIKAVLCNKYTRIHIKSALRFFVKYWGRKNPHFAYELAQQHK